MTDAHTGYLTAASAKDFGAALVKEFVADRAAGGRATGVFGSAVRISLAGTKTAPIVRPHFPMKTLSFTGTDASGKPDNMDPVVVYNLDDSVRIGADQDAINYFSGGSVKFSVPAGNYLAVAYFLDTDADGNVTGMRVVARPQFTVSDNTSMAFAASEATSKVTMITPRPADPQDGGFVLHRTSQAGPDLFLDVGVTPGGPIYVAPTKTPVTLGKLDTYPYRRFGAATGGPYQYHLQYLASGVIPRQFYVATPANTATLDSYFYSDVDSLGAQSEVGAYPFAKDFPEFPPDHKQPVPAHQLIYVSTGPGLEWGGGVAKSTHDFAGIDIWESFQGGAPRQYSPGQWVRENWNTYPLHPAAPERFTPAANDAEVQPGVVRAGDTFTFNLYPFSDNESGHVGSGIYPGKVGTGSGTYELDQDGTKVASGDLAEYMAVPPITVGPAASTIRLVMDASRVGPLYKLSTQSHTEWTWHSQHQTGDGVPDGYMCLPYYPVTHDCSTEPLMTTATTIPGLSLHGTVPGGRQTIGLQFGHLQLTPRSAVTSAKVDYSIDDGKTWLPAKVTKLGDGKYSASYSAVVVVALS
ncbi:hypothetical protein [Fodinicola feengrottensis]|uniref:hypothetical protein n=1 Tax=Fodinicola feengrottensis TaxID=435914 RepID=UPI0013D18251|nr:hypothetical protein [Fodinicola feengrottensis]